MGARTRISPAAPGARCRASCSTTTARRGVEALGLSFARMRALRRLAAQPHTLRELAEQLEADPPYVTLIVDDLEERGLVQRTPHPEDRRAKLVQLTAPAATPPRAPRRSWTSRRPRCGTCPPRTSRRCCACSSGWPPERASTARAEAP